MNPLHTERSPHIGTVLESVFTLSLSLSNPRSTPFGDTVLTRTQIEILFVLAHDDEPVTPGRLAATIKVTPGAITQTMDQLRDQGLVEQTASDSDARVRIWRLTDSAAARVAEFETATVARTAPWFADLSADELGQLAALIRRVVVS